MNEPMAIDVEQYYRKYGPMVLRRCRQLLGDETWACEAMQETFVRLLTYQDRLEGTSPSSLLFRMATHVCLNELRSDRRRGGMRGLRSGFGEDDDELAEIVDQAVDLDRIEARDFLGRLFGSQQESTAVIAALFYLDDMTLEEVAREVGMSVSGVRKRLRGFGEKVRKMKELA